jgi:hypothetical protein
LRDGKLNAGCASLLYGRFVGFVQCTNHVATRFASRQGSNHLCFQRIDSRIVGQQTIVETDPRRTLMGLSIPKSLLVTLQELQAKILRKVDTGSKLIWKSLERRLILMVIAALFVALVFTLTVTPGCA